MDPEGKLKLLRQQNAERRRCEFHSGKLLVHRAAPWHGREGAGSGHGPRRRAYHRLRLQGMVSDGCLGQTTPWTGGRENERESAAQLFSWARVGRAHPWEQELQQLQERAWL